MARTTSPERNWTSGPAGSRCTTSPPATTLSRATPSSGSSRTLAKVFLGEARTSYRQNIDCFFLFVAYKKNLTGCFKLRLSYLTVFNENHIVKTLDRILKGKWL